MRIAWKLGRCIACLFLGLGLVTAWVVAVPATVAGQAAQTGPEVTYTKHVAPILQRSCENCHRAGGVGPMPLSTYAQVRPWARAIRLKTAAREMPPWFIEKNIGIQEFKDDPSLSDAEIATISAWVNAGAPEGNPADMPRPRQFPIVGAWNYGTPDLIVSSPVVTIKAEASDWYGDIGFTPSGLTEDRYIKAVEVREFRPQDERFGRVQGRAQGDLNLFTVHHISVSTLAPGVRSNEESSGTSREEGALRLPKGDFSYLFEVGQNAMIYPDDVGILLPAGSNIYYNVAHLHSIGRELPVQVQVGFTFHPKGYKPKYRPRSVGRRSPIDRVGYSFQCRQCQVRRFHNAAAFNENGDVRAAPARGWQTDVRRGSVSRGIPRSTELCRIQPQLGESVRL